ncbi:MAG: DUF305 domain-containing protein [Pyrinomonadaceae bacterium]
MSSWFQIRSIPHIALLNPGKRIRIVLILAAFLACFLTTPVNAQRADPNLPIVVQPGAPGQPTRVLPAATRAALPPRSLKDVEFMQEMIHHHAQAVEMTDMIEARTDSKGIRLLGARISKSQADEMNFMKRWLETRGEPSELKIAAMPAGHSHGHHSGAEMLMPGMLSLTQMAELRKAKGPEFEQLFLIGMIQHHEGALVMVKDLHATAGAGQDAELFNFATDVDTGQRAEISIMRNMLGEKPVKERL